MTIPLGNTNSLPPPYRGPAISQSSSVAQIAAYLNYEGKSGAAYTSWANAAIRKDPALTPYNAAIAWLTGTGTGAAVGAAATGTGNMLQQIASGSAIGAANVAKNIPNPLNILTGINAIGDFFQRLGQANTWIRAGEVVLGLLLVAVGIAQLTKAVPIATKIAKAVK